MFSYMLVGGRFDDQEGKASGYMNKLFNAMKAINHDGQMINGGSFSKLKELVDTKFNWKYEVLFWMPDVPNDKEKLVKQIKKNFPECILVTSKNNLDNKYSFMELVARALSIKSNLFVEFTRQEDTGLITAGVYDPLGNCFLNPYSDIQYTAVRLMSRVEELTKFTRVRSSPIDGEIPVPINNELEQFFTIVRRYADVFHECIHPADTSRLLGNASFRCESGFPSFKTQDQVFVSRRNIDKREIMANSFVPVHLVLSSFSSVCVRYKGEFKPSVDTPIQLLLYNYYPNIKFMIHSHVYLKCLLLTSHIIPCGALEEFYEIINLCPSRDTKKLAINLKGHGSLMLGSSVEDFVDLPYIARKVPENTWEVQGRY